MSRFRLLYPTASAVAACVTALVLSSCGPDPSSTGTGGSPPQADPVIADLIVQGRIYTVDAAQPWAEAVAIRDGAIVRVGDTKSTDPHVGASTRIVDVGERMVLPGFIDTHAHPMQAVGLRYALLLDVFMDVDEILTALMSYADSNAERPLLLGFGFNELQFGSDGPRKEVLDAVIADKPVVLIDSGGHSAWLNSRALEVFGIDKDTPDPIPGAHYYQRDEDGTPTGWLLESQTFFPPLAEFGAYDTEAALDETNFVYSLFRSSGITTVYDAGMSSFEPIALEVAAELERRGTLPFRLVASHMIQNPNQVPGAIARFRELETQYNRGRLRVGMIKIHNDGTVGARTAAFLEPYSDFPESSGSVLLEPSMLDTLVAEADAEGIDLHIHAIGDRTVRESLDAIEVARRDNPAGVTRHTIAHVELTSDADLPRFAELGVIVQTTAYWQALIADESRAALGDDRFDRAFRFRELVDSGVRVTFGSDFPATGGPVFAMAPLWNIEVGHTRRLPGVVDGPINGGAEARLSLEEMIRGYTLDAAYQLRMEGEVGSLEDGKQADLVVLDRNLFEVPPQEIHQVRVDATVLGGQVVFGQFPSDEQN